LRALRAWISDYDDYFQPLDVFANSEEAEELSQLKIESLYHHQFNEAQGDESEPTFFHQYNLNKAYHIDYVFMPNHLLGTSELRIGDMKKTIQYSDHRPLIIDLN